MRELIRYCPECDTAVYKNDVGSDGKGWCALHGEVIPYVREGDEGTGYENIPLPQPNGFTPRVWSPDVGEYVVVGSDAWREWQSQNRVPSVNETEGYPDDNPKTVFGVKKLPLHLVPPSASAYLAMAFSDGAGKYGPYNWREKHITASVYYAAMRRHIDAWYDGEENATDSNLPHLAHAIACIAMIIDSTELGIMNDDRPPPGTFAKILRDWTNRLEGEKE